MADFITIPAPKYRVGQKVRQYDGKEYTIVSRSWSDTMRHWYYSSGTIFSKNVHREVDVKEVIDGKQE